MAATQIPTPDQHRVHFGWLQAGRGIAAVLVVLGHAALLHERRTDSSWMGGLFDDGTLGVYYFFVLSGFIVVWVHRKDIGHAERSQRYAYKRLTRVYPMYWAVTLAILPVYFWFPDFYQGYDGDPLDVVRSFVLWPTRELPILSVGWTLVHEMLFYIVVGLAIAFGRRLGLTVAVLILGLSVYKFVADFGHSFTDGKYLTGQTFLDETEFTSVVFSRFNLLFAAGAAVAVISVKVLPRSGRHLRQVLVLAATLFAGPLVLLALGVDWMSNLTNDRSGVILYYGASSAFLVLVSVTCGFSPQGPKVPKILEHLGDASYSIYLIHYPALIVADKTLAASGVEGSITAELFAFLGAAAATAAGVVAYRLVEQPLLKFSRRFGATTPIRQAAL